MVDPAERFHPHDLSEEEPVPAVVGVAAPAADQPQQPREASRSRSRSPHRRHHHRSSRRANSRSRSRSRSRSPHRHRDDRVDSPAERPAAAASVATSAPPRDAPPESGFVSALPRTTGAGARRSAPPRRDLPPLGFDLESFERTRGVLVFPDDCSSIEASMDHDLEVATHHSETLLHRLVWTDPAGAPTEEELATEEDRDIDLRQAAVQLTAPGRIQFDQLHWIARLRTPDGRPSNFILIQLGLRAHLKMYLAKFSGSDPRRPLVPYLEWLLTPKRLAPLGYSDMCHRYFTLVRVSSDGHLESRCRLGARCTKSHDPRLMDQFISRLRDEARGSLTSSVVPASYAFVQLAAAASSDDNSANPPPPPLQQLRMIQSRCHLTQQSPAIWLRVPEASSLNDSHPYRPCYELGSVLFGPGLQADQIIRVESDFAFPPECELNLQVPMGPQFLSQYRDEFTSTGQLSLKSRWVDAQHGISVLRQYGLLKDDTALRMAYRLGPEAEFNLLLHFDSKQTADEVRKRFEAKRQERLSQQQQQQAQ